MTAIVTTNETPLPALIDRAIFALSGARTAAEVLEARDLAARRGCVRQETVAAIAGLGIQLTRGAMEHPIKALGTMLLNSAKPLHRETWTQFLIRNGISDDAYRAMTEAERIAVTEAWLGQAIRRPPININSLDPYDARGVEDVIDLDRERAKRDGELIETPNGE